MFWSSVVIVELLFASLFCLPGYASGDQQTKDSAGDAATESVGARSENREQIRVWFNQYDKIRKRAKMSFVEKIEFRHVMALAMSPFAFYTVDGGELLRKMISRYGTAVEEMEDLPQVDEVARLREGYLRYFKEAKELFEDVNEAEKKGAMARRKLLPKFAQRKRELEILDQENKQLDARLRKENDIPPL
jgi:hypothetical protein